MCCPHGAYRYSYRFSSEIQQEMPDLITYMFSPLKTSTAWMTSMLPPTLTVPGLIYHYYSSLLLSVCVNGWTHTQLLEYLFSRWSFSIRVSWSFLLKFLQYSFKFYLCLLLSMGRAELANSWDVPNWCQLFAFLKILFKANKLFKFPAFQALLFWKVFKILKMAFCSYFSQQSWLKSARCTHAVYQMLDRLQIFSCRLVIHCPEAQAPAKSQARRKMYTDFLPEHNGHGHKASCQWSSCC